MLDALRQRTVAKVLFDEHHGEAWSIRPEAAARMRPSHPAAASYATAAAELTARDFDAVTTAGRPLDEVALADVDVLVIAHPSDPKWERTVGADSPVFSPAEIAAVQDFVARGGGLVVLGEEEEDKYGGNLNDLLAPFGVRFENTIVFEYDPGDGVPSWVVGESAPKPADPGILHGVGEVGFYRAGALSTDDPGAVVLRTRATADPPGAALVAATQYKEGRVVVVADSDLFGDDYLSRRDNRRLWMNLLYWVSLAAFRADATPIVSEAAQDPAWLHLKEATGALRLLQEPKGEVDLSRHDAGEVRALVVAMAEAIADLAPRFPHQKEYLAQVVADLDAWVESGCGKPDFKDSLALFRPDLERRDGVEHLVVFPMYTPNGSPDTRFEALITRTPWPEFVAQIERELYDNPKFVPVQLVDNTAGYDSECAVLFPETVSVAERPTNHFGAIFCDRESARYRRTTLWGAEVLDIDLPPDARALASSPDLALETYILWDMIHDRWHSHGDLPFDPFMIRQRLPYWMYSLEELRVDLATYGTADELAATFPLRALRQVRDPLRPSPALPHHRQPRAQLRRSGRPAALRLSARARRRAVDRQPAAHRLGADRLRRRRAARAGRAAVSARDRDQQGDVLDRRARPHLPVRDPQRRLPVAQGGARLLRRGRAARLDRQGAGRRVPSQHVLRVAEEEGRDVSAPLTLFASDNYAGAHPAVLEAVASANEGWAPAYGDDPWTGRLRERLREVLGDVEAFPVFNGTGGNVTVLAALLRPYEAVICPETAHINVDECGAPERIAGAKLVDVPTPDGKLTPELLRPRLVGFGDQHHVQARVVSISQSTELGTVYAPQEIAALAETAHEAGLLLHMDGARLVNAAQALGLGLRELTTDCGVDVLTLGGTKSGLLGAEAAVFFRPELAAGYLYARKQGTQLASKMRYISAQLLRLFEGDLWRETAGHANAMARRLGDAVAATPGVTLAYPVQANAVFAALPAAVIERLHERYHFYVWDEDAGVVRWMCSWQTSAGDVDALAGALREAVSG